MYVSITGLKPKSALQVPRFWWHAIRSMMQAQRSPGNLRAEARTVNGVHHTMTLWTDKAAMRAYLGAGAHLKAMQAFRGIGTGAVTGFEATAAPDWADVPEIWRTRGREI